MMGFVFTLLISIVLMAILVEGNPTADFYNLDAHNFNYFKYPARPTTRYGLRQVDPDPSLGQRAKAVYTYFRNLLLGHPIQQNTYNIMFDPDRALRLRGAYQRQFGVRGENLIALIGNGYSPSELRYYGAVGREFKGF
ncbi:uncharacterized protein LOC129770546 [Toxorhynchites rutilus septentrionalis]|uniref:uncharacterized protein LOC129770546 n=1 Tax=Toxorhynchites rutilus septentrionalis TaxID=329112 RepID=UPI002478DF18|nr:uncharacterized protein LOC129770546 [Toxorhynchites rutilus septentrionalis]